MAGRYLYGETGPTLTPILTAQAVLVCDLVGLSSGNVVRAEDITWNTDLATTQTDFANAFLGVCGQQKAAGTVRPYGNSADNRIRIDTEGVFEFDCASATFAVGDFLGAAKQTGNALESQKLVGVASEALAIARCVEAGASVTKVKARMLSKKAPSARQS